MYQNTSFTPVFLEDFNSTRLAEANETCKGERGCLFDFLITGNKAIADNSKRVMDIEVQRQLEAGTELYIAGCKGSTWGIGAILLSVCAHQNAE